MAFPKYFLWGGATANAQYEGGYNEGGRGLSQIDFCECIGKNKGGTEYSHELS
ncbi:MAG: family 1 glycosylhydrolase, partial [Erysipelotrichaceae bacterium]|nr:family 1 glycosylhydrolase [Erysipelotrichaceae bacterium]